MAKTDTVDPLYSSNKTRAVISVTENNPAANYKIIYSSLSPGTLRQCVPAYTDSHTHTQTHFCNYSVAQNH